LTTSSHTKHGYLTKDSESIRKHNQHLIAKIHDHIQEITLVKYDHQPGAETLVISYGISAQAAEVAVENARDQGQTVSSLIIHSLWPVPEDEIRAALSEAKRVIIPELNLGLYRREIERLTSDRHEIIGITRLDGGMISPDQILGAIKS
jgi:2-oxoglutarate ferredoxin oxidoreductase subunit alpha